ncbi:VOC family protein [uncultured Phenylobacterium sp.]|uniref:VOC family protein n=1 Tax=uncultured Phenylobacterium sp. TaxID=349273 RepID=UPI0025D1FC55|nr:VOC family protein [uncultured Phenylobacterium sp.]
MSDHGRWIWYELITPDMDGAKRFYGDLLGWTAQDLPPMADGEPYAVLSADGNGVAGIMNLGEAMKAEGMPPNWTGYICVDDCDAASAKVKSLGGSVRREAWDIPGIGRIAIVADPAGAVFAIMKPTPPDGGRPAPDSTALGQCGWHELMGAAPETGFDFYAQMFGWTKDEAMDMGPVGTYQLYSNQDGQVGAMMKKPADMPMPYWGFYFRVADIDAAAAKIRAGGGQVLNGPMDVPGDDRIINATDPQGAVFSIVAKKA